LIVFTTCSPIFGRKFRNNCAESDVCIRKKFYAGSVLWKMPGQEELFHGAYVII